MRRHSPLPLRLLFALTAVLLVLPLVPAGAQEADGRIFYAAPGGGNTQEATGSMDDPWGDIEYALYELAPGDTLHLRGGEYRQRINVRKPLAHATADRPITVSSAPGERATIVGGLDTGNSDGFHHWVLRDLDVTWDAQNPTLDDTAALVRLGSGVGWVLDGVEISGARSYANLRVFNRHEGQARDWVIRDSCIHDTIPTRTDRQNTEHNIYVGMGSNAADKPVGAGVIEDSYVFNARNGANIKLGAGEPGLPGTRGIVVRNNVLANAPQNVIIPWQSRDNTVENNLLIQQDNGSWSQPWYPNVRGLELTGTGNVARNNAGQGTGGVVGNNTSRVAVADVENVLLDPGATGVGDVSCSGLANREPPGSGWGPDATDLPTRRLAGGSRIETSTTLSREAHPDGADTVLLARSDSYADALAGAPLAGSLGAPLLLTTTSGLTDEVRAEIDRLGATRAVLLGGPGALSSAVERQVEGLGLDVERIAGGTRFATAAAVAAELEPTGSAYVVEGANPDPTRGWPDAVALSGLAARTGSPVLLTTRSELPAETRDALAALDLEGLTVVGGTAAVSADVQETAQREAGLPRSSRLSGGTRYDTSAAIGLEATELGADPSEVWLVTGLNWPDALAAGPASATLGATLLFVNGLDARQSPPTLDWLRERADADELAITLVGGPGAISAFAESTLAFGVPR